MGSCTRWVGLRENDEILSSVDDDNGATLGVGGHLNCLNLYLNTVGRQHSARQPSIRSKLGWQAICQLTSHTVLAACSFVSLPSLLFAS